MEIAVQKLSSPLEVTLLILSFVFTDQGLALGSSIQFKEFHSLRLDEFFDS